MSKEEFAKKIFNDYENRIGCWPAIIAFILAFILGILTSCATKTKIEYVDREVVKYEYKTRYDTIYENTHDSIFQTIYQKGDTIYNVKYKEKIKYKDKIVNITDTIVKDSIQYVQREEIREKKIIPKWCYYSLFVCFLFIIFAIYKIYTWLR